MMWKRGKRMPISRRVKEGDDGMLVKTDSKTAPAQVYDQVEYIRRQLAENERRRVEEEARAQERRRMRSMPPQTYYMQSQNDPYGAMIMPTFWMMPAAGQQAQQMNLANNVFWDNTYGNISGFNPQDGTSPGPQSVAVVEPVATVVEAPARTMLKRVPVVVQNLDDPIAVLARDAEALLGYRGLRRHVKAPGRLRTALAKLEIEILDERTVNTYKAQMVLHYETTNKMPQPTWRLKSLRQYTQPVPEFVLEKAVQIKRELPEAEFYVDQLAVDPFLIVALDPPTDFIHNRDRELDPEIAAYIDVWNEPKFEGSI